MLIELCTEHLRGKDCKKSNLILLVFHIDFYQKTKNYFVKITDDEFTSYDCKVLLELKFY